MATGRLFVVATPIGNLEDMTFRAIEILKKVSLIACEDTRQTRKLLNRYGIRARCTSYHKFNELSKTDRIIGEIEQGKDVALVSDAGTPGISDPGYHLIKLLSERGADIIPIPGASAITSALSISAIPLDSFSFYGFIPKKRSERERFLKDLSTKKETLVFFESPHRIIGCISDMILIFGSRKALVCRELTKMHEDVMRGTLSEILERMKKKTPASLKGEFTIVLQGAEDHPSFAQPIPIYEQFKLLVDENNLEPREAMKIIARDRGLAKNAVYREILKQEGKLKDSY
jgi:16S rRNA (cytidine1402-2'-O)-methyltransferase